MLCRQVRSTASTRLTALSRQTSPRRRQAGRPRANQPGAFDGALLGPTLRYGVRLPNQMKLAPLPSVTVMVQPEPFAHDGPLVGNVWCQPACTVSQTV